MTLWRWWRTPCVLGGIVCASSLAWADMALAAPPVAPAKVWPETLVIDDFSQGLGRWKNEDSGKLELARDGADGKPYLKWTAADDGIGHIVFASLDKGSVDFSKYDLLHIRYRIGGKVLNNLNPVIQQYPFNQGFRALFYAIDTLDVRLGEWQSYTLDLRLLENSWPDSFSPTKQEFQFEIYQEAGAGTTEFSLAEVVLLRNVLRLQRSYAGQWRAGAAGAQEWTFQIPLVNTGKAPLRVQIAPVPGSFSAFMPEVKHAQLELAAGQNTTCDVTVSIPATAVKEKPPCYGEMVELEFAAEGMPELRLRTQLSCGIMAAAERARHPVILGTPEHLRDLRRRYADPELRKGLDPYIVRVFEDAKHCLKHQPTYPPCANRADAFRQCLMDKAVLVEVPMPNLPETSYQCPQCGRFYRGMFYDAAIKGWFKAHMANAEAVQRAGIGYLLTGDQVYAAKAAEILKGCADVYLKLPIAAGSGVHTQIVSSGATRIGGSFMQEQNWLTNLAVGLDCIWDSGALTPADKQRLRDQLFVPSANLMMDHRVGLMNLQWMIDRAGVFAGLAAEAPDLVARAVYGDHGVVALMDKGFLTDDMWRENPSYINVFANEGYPVLGTLFLNRILPYTPAMDRRYKAMWRLAAPDDRFPTLGTGGPPDLSIMFNGVKAIAKLSSDPEIAWIDQQKPFVRPIAMYFSAIAAAFQAEGCKVPPEQAQPIKPVTMSFPDYGVAVLRTPESDMYSALAFGRHLIHGHYNKMSVNAYGKGGWFMRNLWAGYGEGFSEHLEATAGSSTVMVDGRNQDADTGELLFLKSTGLAQLTCAREKGAWKDVEHTRTLVQTGSWLLMIDRCVAEKEHLYDWLYHGQTPGPKNTALAWADGPAVKGAVDSLGKEPCYPFFLPAEERAVGGDTMRVRYQRPDGSGVQLSLLNEAGTEGQLFRTLSEKRWPHEGLIQRQRGKTVRFAALFEPLAKGETAQAVLTPLALTDAKTGKPVAWAEAQAFVVAAGGTKLAAVVNYAGLALKLGDGTPVPGTDPVTAVPLP